MQEKPERADEFLLPASPETMRDSYAFVNREAADDSREVMKIAEETEYVTTLRANRDQLFVEKKEQTETQEACMAILEIAEKVTKLRESTGVQRGNYTDDSSAFREKDDVDFVNDEIAWVQAGIIESAT